MAVYFDHDAREELRIITEWSAMRQAAQNQGRKWSPAQSVALTRWAEAAPWMDAQVMLDFTRAGVDPDSPEGYAAIEASGIDYFAGPRQGREPVEALGRASTIAASRTKAGISPDAQAWLDEHMGGSAASDIARSVVRGGFTLLNAPIQEAQGVFRTVVGNVREDGVLSGVAQAAAEVVPSMGLTGQSDAAIITDQLLRGEEIETGSGFFVGEASEVGRRRLKRELRHGTVDGQVITPGRWAVDTFTGLDRGDRFYGAASGTVDAAFTLLADPVDVAARPIRAGARAARAFRGAGHLGDGVETLTRRVPTGDPARNVVFGGADDLGITDDVDSFRLTRDAADNLDDAGRSAVDELRNRGWSVEDGDDGLTFRRPTRERVDELDAQIEELRGRLGVTDDAPGTGVVPFSDTPEDPLRVQLGELLAERARVRARTRPWFMQPDESVMREEAVGLYPRGVVPSLDPKTFAGWLTTDPRGIRVVEALAAESDARTIRHMTRGRMVSSTVLRIADTTDPDEVRRILWDEGQLVIGDMGYRLAAPRFRRTSWTRRIRADMPADRVHLEDGEGFVEAIENMLINARVDDGQIGQRVRQAMEADDRTWRVLVLEDALEDIRRSLVDNWGVDEEIARAVTAHIQRTGRTGRLFDVDGSGFERALWSDEETVVINGTTYSAGHKAKLGVEIAPDIVDIPNIREIRRLTSTMQRFEPLARLLYTKDGRFQWPWEMVERLSNAWKRTTVLRPAWTGRQVLGDEQLRMAAHGMPSLFRNPLHYIVALISDPKMAKRMEELADEPNGAWTLTEEWQASMMRGLIDPARARRRGLDDWEAIDRADPRFVEAWGRELGQLSADIVTRNLAGGMSIDEVTAAMLDDATELGRRRRALAHLHPDDMADFDGVRRYVGFLYERLHLKTGGNADLMDAVANGGLRRFDGSRSWFTEPRLSAPSEDFASILHGYLDNAPDVVKAERFIEDRANLGDLATGFTNWAFDLLGARPSNFLSRSPAFRWFYFEAIADAMGLLDDAARARMFRQADNWRIVSGVQFSVGGHRFGVGDALRDRMKRSADAADGTGRTTFTEADAFARAEAMRRTQNLLGDFSIKNQFMDAMRLIMPFGTAWAEAMAAYYRTLKSNPLVIYDGLKGVEGAMDSGFFRHDPYGELVFTYPASAWFMQNVPGGPGVPFPLTGRARGLTMSFEVMPGFGPVMQFPAQWLLPETPAWDGVRDIVMPYGVENPVTVLTPEWLEKIGVYAQNAQGDSIAARFARTFGAALGGDTVQSQTAYASSVGDVATYLATTGDYDLSTLGGRANLMADAEKAAAHQWAWRGLAQAFAPAAPRPEAVMLREDGELAIIAAATQRLVELRQEDPLNAGRRFLDEFGDLAFMLLAPKSESNALYIASDEFGDNWVRENRDLLRTYPEYAALFAPTGGGSAGIGRYFRAIEEGLIEAADPEDRLRRGQDALASILYREARQAALEEARALGRSSIPEAAQDELREYREELRERFPGYLAEGTNLPDFGRTIVDLEEMMRQEPRFAATEAGQALERYLTARRTVLDELEAADAPGLSSSAASEARGLLVAFGEQLVTEHPSFVNLWERVLSREVDLIDDGGD